ncbi:MAG: two pore domain potassium channel family protein [Alphaproteobacteria bacterium]|nr:two pore domain potassium channel family protein [Alphaproteobacteria bacterium]
MVGLTCLMYYELTRVVWDFLPRLRLPARLRVLVVVGSIFAGHTLAVWIYGCVYWLVEHYTGLGWLDQARNISFMSAVYFSAATYSSLGYGDLVPTGPIRLLASVQVLNGLVLIGWSVSFTYLSMEKFWDLHRKK